MVIDKRSLPLPEKHLHASRDFGCCKEIGLLWSYKKLIFVLMRPDRSSKVVTYWLTFCKWTMPTLGDPTPLPFWLSACVQTMSWFKSVLATRVFRTEQWALIMSRKTKPILSFKASKVPVETDILFYILSNTVWRFRIAFISFTADGSQRNIPLIMTGRLLGTVYSAIAHCSFLILHDKTGLDVLPNSFQLSLSMCSYRIDFTKCRLASVKYLRC